MKPTRERRSNPREETLDRQGEEARPSGVLLQPEAGSIFREARCDLPVSAGASAIRPAIVVMPGCWG